jgi:hypothetical protein
MRSSEPSGGSVRHRCASCGKLFEQRPRNQKHCRPAVSAASTGSRKTAPPCRCFASYPATTAAAPTRGGTRSNTSACSAETRHTRQAARDPVGQLPPTPAMDTRRSFPARRPHRTTGKVAARAPADHHAPPSPNHTLLCGGLLLRARGYIQPRHDRPQKNRLIHFAGARRARCAPALQGAHGRTRDSGD